VVVSALSDCAFEAAGDAALGNGGGDNDDENLELRLDSHDPLLPVGVDGGVGTLSCELCVGPVGVGLSGIDRESAYGRVCCKPFGGDAWAVGPLLLWGVASGTTS
jgi:hypothetical protein